MMNNTERIVAWNRDEDDVCQRSTLGCCIDHEAEARRSGWDPRLEASCEPW